MSEWETLRSEIVHRNPILQLLEERIRTPHGMESPWSVVTIQDGAAVAPIHEDGSITMVRQYRHAVGRWMWEFPAGRVEAGEEAEAAGRRELAEEVGLVADSYRYRGVLHPLAGICRHQIHIFEARQLTATATAHEDFEQMTIERLSRAELRKLVQDDELTDGVALSIIARLGLLGDIS